MAPPPHCLVTNGAFTPAGTFHALEILSPSVIREVFQHKVFKMLLKEGLITEERVRMILSWKHTGFHIHNEGKVVANDAEGRERMSKIFDQTPCITGAIDIRQERSAGILPGKGPDLYLSPTGLSGRSLS